MKAKWTGWSSHCAWAIVIVALTVHLEGSASLGSSIAAAFGGLWEVVPHFVVKPRSGWRAYWFDVLPWIIGASAAWFVWR